MATNETAGAAADETTRRPGKVICLDIPNGYRGYVAPTPQLITASRTPYGWVDEDFVNPYRMCRCRARKAASAAASGRLDAETKLISATPHFPTQLLMARAEATLLVEPSGTRRASVPKKLLELALRADLGGTKSNRVTFGGIYPPAGDLVLAARGSDQCFGVLARFAGKEYREAAADTTLVDVVCMATDQGRSYCEGQVDGENRGAVLDAAAVRFAEPVLETPDGLKKLECAVMSSDGGGFLKSPIGGSIRKRLVCATSAAGCWRAQADGESPLKPAFGAIVLAHPFQRCGAFYEWFGHWAEIFLQVMLEVLMITQGFPRPPVDGLAGVVRVVADLLYQGGARPEDFGLTEGPYNLGHVDRLLKVPLDDLAARRSANAGAVVHELRGVAQGEVERVQVWALGAVEASFVRGLEAVAKDGLEPAVEWEQRDVTQLWTVGRVKAAAAELRASLDFETPLEIHRALPLNVPLLSDAELDMICAGGFPENGSGCCVFCGLPGGGATVLCGCGAMAHVACVDGGALSQTNCPVCKDVEARAIRSKAKADAAKKRKERFAAPAHESTRPRRKCKE